MDLARKEKIIDERTCLLDFPTAELNHSRQQHRITWISVHMVADLLKDTKITPADAAD
ncbi:hypothetical protein SLEP1_g20244 [Rubroshorea leprosula]|uniref:Uncharacterized protein n=1 Tax=Rubroshorea leprosula TaxID=152421 RepID=A0AAV5JCQ2_9ROSI|nr:hypothetical protein SLEP1_g20244 [Rubroshorea leprosula]